MRSRSITVTTTGPAVSAADAPLGAQGGQQAVNADGNAGGGHGLAGEAFDQIVIAPAARDRAELALAALFVKDFKGQFGLEHRAGVVAKAAHDAGVDHDAVGAVALRGQKFGNGFKFLHAFQPRWSEPANQIAQARRRWRRRWRVWPR